MHLGARKTAIPREREKMAGWERVRFIFLKQQAPLESGKLVQGKRPEEDAALFLLIHAVKPRAEQAVCTQQQNLGRNRSDLGKCSSNILPSVHLFIPWCFLSKNTNKNYC